jgi:hypothetical protein
MNLPQRANLREVFFTRNSIKNMRKFMHVTKDTDLVGGAGYNSSDRIVRGAT